LLLVRGVSCSECVAAGKEDACGVLAGAITANVATGVTLIVEKSHVTLAPDAPTLEPEAVSTVSVKPKAGKVLELVTVGCACEAKDRKSRAR
jgi:hypothetical protein